MRDISDRWTPAETAIGEAMRVVEAMPADVRLTQAMILLGKAKDAVAEYADYVDAILRAASNGR